MSDFYTGRRPAGDGKVVSLRGYSCPRQCSSSFRLADLRLRQMACLKGQLTMTKAARSNHR
jgi:hypothetical protein